MTDKGGYSALTDLSNMSHGVRLRHPWSEESNPSPAKCVHELFVEQVLRSPGSIAVSCGAEKLTYAQLNFRANELASRLVEMGVELENVVGVCIERSIDMLVGVLGIMKAGGAYLPLDPDYPQERLAFMLHDSKARFLVTSNSLRQALPTFKGAVTLVGAAGNGSSQKPGLRVMPVEASNLAYVLYTSGSTGNPKGVQIEHTSLVNCLTSMLQAPGLGRDDVMVAVTTLSFDIAALELFLPLIAGARVEIVSRAIAADAEQLRDVIQDVRATVMQATPVTWRMLLNSGWPNLELKVICGGEALSRELARQLVCKSRSVWNVYGPTETTIWSSIYRVTGKDESAIVPIGRPIANTQMYVLNEKMEEVAGEEGGELFIGGKGVARGYLNQPKLTAEKFIENPFAPGTRLYRTGDIARVNGTGDFEFLGRKDHQVKIRGYRVELGEIEAVLEEYPNVQQAAVISQEVEGDIRLVAYLVAKREGEEKIPAEELRLWAKKKLPDYMLPAAFVQLEKMPLTANGKVDRRALPRPANVAFKLDACRPAESQDPLEQRLLSIWRSLLGRNDLMPDHDFFESGGHSLLAIRVMQQVERECGAKLPIATLFQFPTVSRFAQKVREQTGKAPDKSRTTVTAFPNSAERRRKGVFRRAVNRVLHMCCRLLPGATGIRPALHKLRGVHVGRDVFIGDDVYLENEYPERVELRNGVTVGLRSVIIAHGMGGPGRIVVEDNAFIGCNCLLIISRSRTLTIGQGSVVMAGSVVTSDVPPFSSVGPSPARESTSAA